ncbi:hypothetical protein IJ22_48050 [Paenibacillus naphthalenovorans]|uniref:Uncharacterized protein n=1 Tax=Paenibacillus naphthalenovorans TaxID=162209 RepID=A0A0U2INQ1_9BACL|nr:hypothetical protein IJ22_48050 [Paenibacillus naphthalenovorans]
MGMTVREIAHGTGTNLTHFEIHTGNFLDEFYRSGREKRQQMVEQEPDHYDHLPVHLLPFLAGWCISFAMITTWTARIGCIKTSIFCRNLISHTMPKETCV